MSHSKERAEKICLNCKAELIGRYCQRCGQENIEPKQTAWHLVTHFFSDITHFDGKFFITVKDLFIKPGFLSTEYIQGRRISYLDPIRMYIFTSAIFFIVFFSIIPKDIIHANDRAKQSLLKDPDAFANALANVHTNADTAAVRRAYAQEVLDSTIIGRNDRDSSDKDDDNGFFHPYATIAKFDSVQHTLPPAQRMGWMNTKIKHRLITLNNQYREDPTAFKKESWELLLHNFPKLLFLSLPLFAFLLEFIYLRRRQRFYYVDHGIFAVHLYIFSFLLLLVGIFVNKFKTFSGWEWIGWIEGAVYIFCFWYYYKAMRNFYGQGKFKTFLKFFLLCILSLIMMMCLFTLFLIVTAIEL